MFHFEKRVAQVYVLNAGVGPDVDAAELDGVGSVSSPAWT